MENFLLHLAWAGLARVKTGHWLLVSIKVPILKYYSLVWGETSATRWLILLCWRREEICLASNKKWWPPLGICHCMPCLPGLPVKGWERERERCPLPCPARPGLVLSAWSRPAGQWCYNRPDGSTQLLVPSWSSDWGELGCNWDISRQHCDQSHTMGQYLDNISLLTAVLVLASLINGGGEFINFCLVSY